MKCCAILAVAMAAVLVVLPSCAGSPAASVTGDATTTTKAATATMGAAYTGASEQDTATTSAQRPAVTVSATRRSAAATTRTARPSGKTGASPKPTAKPATTTAGVIKPTKPDSGALTVGKPLTGTKRIQKVATLTEAPTAMEMVEFELLIGGIADSVNVYDPAQVSLDMTVKSSNGKTLKVSGFYYVPYELENDKKVGGKPSGEATWRFRFTPLNEGTWDFTITLSENGKMVDSIGQYINVAVAKDTRGFLGVEPVRKQVFAFQDGTPYIPLGENIGWKQPVADDGKTYQYFDSIIRKLARNDASYVRMWLASWCLSLMVYGKAPDDLSSGMQRAYMLDRIMDSYEENDIYTSLCIYNHGMFSVDRANPNWRASPYNDDNPHGYLDHPSKFFTDARAKKDAKIYLRYLVARYGYSRNIMTWELFNEIDGTNGDPEEAMEWHREMTAYLREIDPYGHMVSTSAANYPNPIPRNQIFDFVYFHRYNYGALKSLVDLQRTTNLQYQRPCLLGETGILLDGLDPVGPVPISVHQQNWAGIMGGGGGAAINWFWEQTEANNTYSDFKPVAAFANRIPWSDPKMKPFDTLNASINNTKVQIIGYRGEKYAYFWMYDTNYSLQNPKITDFTDVEFSATMKDGTYQVEWIDPWSGSTVKTENLTTSDGKLAFRVPKWNRDLAVAITVAK